MPLGDLQVFSHEFWAQQGVNLVPFKERCWSYNNKDGQQEVGGEIRMRGSRWEGKRMGMWDDAVGKLNIVGLSEDMPEVMWLVSLLFSGSWLFTLYDNFHHWNPLHAITDPGFYAIYSYLGLWAIRPKMVVALVLALVLCCSLVLNLSSSISSPATALLWKIFQVSYVHSAPTGYSHIFISAHSESFSCQFTLDHHVHARVTGKHS
jgi:hypothetical protein